MEFRLGKGGAALWGVDRDPSPCHVRLAENGIAWSGMGSCDREWDRLTGNGITSPGLGSRGREWDRSIRAGIWG